MDAKIVVVGSLNMDLVVRSPRIPVPGETPIDGLEFYSARTRPGDYGSFDILVRTRETMDSPWSESKNLGSPVNTPYSEDFPTISHDGLELYFSDYERPRPGGCGSEDLWVTRRVTRSAPWQGRYRARRS